MSQTAPAIPLFGDAYLADTRHLSLEEHGAYLQLMMIAWRIDGCCLPNDDARLARMLGVTAAKWKKLKPVVMAFWSLEDGAWKQARLSKERKFVDEKRAKNKASADARWNGQAVENKEAEQCERISERNAPPPPPNRSKKERDKPSPTQTAFPRPDWADRQVWSDFLANRKAKRLTNSATAYRGFLAAIAQFSDDEWPPGRLLEHAASKGWGSINDPRQDHRNGHSQSHPGQSNGLRGSRPNPALDLIRSAAIQRETERGDEATDRRAWPSLPAFGPS